MRSEVSGADFVPGSKSVVPRVELPNVIIQFEAVSGRWSSELSNLASLIEGLSAFGVQACFFAYGRTAREIKEANNVLQEAAKQARTSLPDLVFMTERTIKVSMLYALTSCGGTFHKTLLFHASEYDLVGRSAVENSIEFVECSRNNQHITPTFFIQHVAQSHLRTYQQVKMELERPIVVGCIMRTARAHSLARQNLLHLQVDGGVCYVPVDHDVAIDDQQSTFDILLHKVSDWIVYNERKADVNLALPSVFESLGNESIPWVDAADKTRPICSRTEIHKILSELKLEQGQEENLSGSLVLPTTTLLEDNSKIEGRAPPLIIKSNAACGVSFSHKMVIVRHLDEGELAKHLETCFGQYRDLVVQDYLPHDGYEMKVYCIGEEVHMFKRKVAECLTDDLPPLYCFDSLELKSKNADEENYPICDADKALLCDCAKRLRAKMNVKLFGFDALKVKGTTTIAIIDINYFPSFKGIPEARSGVHKVVKQKL